MPVGFSDELKKVYDSFRNAREVKAVTYGDEQIKLIENGIDGVDDVIFGDDKTAVRSMLFALERYLDPYYNCPLPYRERMYDSLHRLLTTTDDDDIIDDVLDLMMYEDNDIFLRENIDRIKPERQADVRDRFSWAFE